MNNIEIELVQEYKRLDLLLKDMFETETGVSEYISRMENVRNAAGLVSGWNRDLEKLKRIRHIRNKIMHDEGYSFCEDDDIDYIVDFYDRLLDQDDPLAKLRKYKKQKQTIQQQPYINYSDDEDYNNNNKLNMILTVLLIMLVFSFVAVLIILL